VKGIVNVIRVPVHKSLHVGKRYSRVPLLDQGAIIASSQRAAIAGSLPIVIYLRMDAMHATRIICDVAVSTRGWAVDAKGGI
jgi:hypothetical protein